MSDVYMRIRNKDTGENLLLGVRNGKIVCFDKSCTLRGVEFAENCRHVEQAKNKKNLKRLLRDRGANIE